MPLTSLFYGQSMGPCSFKICSGLFHKTFHQAKLSYWTILLATQTPRITYKPAGRGSCAYTPVDRINLYSSTDRPLKLVSLGRGYWLRRAERKRESGERVSSAAQPEDLLKLDLLSNHSSLGHGSPEAGGWRPGKKISATWRSKTWPERTAVAVVWCHGSNLGLAREPSGNAGCDSGAWVGPTLLISNQRPGDSPAAALGPLLEL